MQDTMCYFSVFIEKNSGQQPFSSSVTTKAKLPVWKVVGGTKIITERKGPWEALYCYVNVHTFK